MKDGDKYTFSLLFLDLKVSLRSGCFSNALRRGFSVNTSMFFFIFIIFPVPSRLRNQHC